MPKTVNPPIKVLRHLINVLCSNSLRSRLDSVFLLISAEILRRIYICAGNCFAFPLLSTFFRVCLVFQVSLWIQLEKFLFFPFDGEKNQVSLKRKFLIFFLSLITFTFSLVVFFEVLENQKSMAKNEFKRYQSYLLVDGLKQNSDNLTRMARSYVATGEPRFKEYFQRILDIRNGKAPRPKNYRNSYWDLVLATGRKPQRDGEPVAFWTLVEEAGLTHGNLNIFRETEVLVRDLLRMDEKAIHTVDGFYQNEKGGYTVKKTPDKKMAVDFLHSRKHGEIRKKIMDSLKEFSNSVDGEVKRDISLYQSKNKRLITLLWIVAIFSFLLVLVFLFPFNPFGWKAGCKTD